MILTLLSSFSLLAYPYFSAGGVKLPGIATPVVAVLNVAALVMARKHVGGFWKGKAKVPAPGVGDYNDAITNTMELRLNMMYLAMSWVFSGVYSFVDFSR